MLKNVKILAWYATVWCGPYDVSLNISSILVYQFKFLLKGKAETSLARNFFVSFVLSY